MREQNLEKMQVNDIVRLDRKREISLFAIVFIVGTGWTASGLQENVPQGRSARGD